MYVHIHARAHARTHTHTHTHTHTPLTLSIHENTGSHSMGGSSGISQLGGPVSLSTHLNHWINALCSRFLQVWSRYHSSLNQGTSSVISYHWTTSVLSKLFHSVKNVQGGIKIFPVYHPNGCGSKQMYLAKLQPLGASGQWFFRPTKERKLLSVLLWRLNFLHNSFTVKF